MTEIFVFGSNLAGIHGAGSAKEALRNHGAIYGAGVGRQRNSYAIPTKDTRFNVLPLCYISLHVEDFLEHAREHTGDIFNVVAIGCGLAGYNASQIAPMFAGAPSNVKLPKEFLEGNVLIGDHLVDDPLETTSLFDTMVDAGL